MACNNNYNCYCCGCYNECDDEHKHVEVEAMTKEDVLTLWEIIKSKFALIIHKHSAGDIDSGVLSVANGGTGAVDAAGARENLDVPDIDHTHDFSDIEFTQGDVLGVEHGGTGKSETIYIKTNLASNAEDETLKTHSEPGVTGVLDEEHGGTGANTFAGARANLGAAAEDHTHSAEDIASGEIPVERGGTGANSAENARANLEIPDFPNGVLPIAHGGTGAYNATDARSNLGAAAENHTHYTVATVKQYHSNTANNQKIETAVNVGGYIDFTNILAASADSDLERYPDSGATIEAIKVPSSGNYLVSGHLNYKVSSNLNVTIAIRRIRNGTETEIARAMTYCGANEDMSLCIPMQFVSLQANDLLRLFVSQPGEVKTETGASLTAMYFNSGMY